MSIPRFVLFSGFLVGCLADEAAILLGGDLQADSDLGVVSWPCPMDLPDLPRKLQWPGAALIDGSIYLCGGYDGAQVSADCYVMGEDRLWMEGPRMVESRYEFSLNTVADTLVAVQGVGSDGRLNSIEIFRDGAWALTELSLEPARDLHCTVTISDEEIVVIGGYDGSSYMDNVEKININTGAVESLPVMAVPKRGHACTMYQESILVTGGCCGAMEYVELLDLSSLTWTALPSLNTPRSWHTVGIVNGLPVVFGGSGAAEGSIEVLQLEGEGGGWVEESMEVPRDRHAMVLVDCSW